MTIVTTIMITIISAVLIALLSISPIAFQSFESPGRWNTLTGQSSLESCEEPGPWIQKLRSFRDWGFRFRVWGLGQGNLGFPGFRVV